MIAAPNPAQSESFKGSLPAKSLVEVLDVDPADLKDDRLHSTQPAFHKRVPLVVARFLITFSMGVAAAVAWQPYADAARETLARSFPQLRWLAPPAEPAAQNASEAIALATPDAALPSPDRQLGAISLDLDTVRQNIDRLSSSQQQMTRDVDRLVASQAQVAGEIAKLQALGQYILDKNSEPQPPQAPAPRATSRSSQGRTVR
jgi:hypothetical protein